MENKNYRYIEYEMNQNTKDLLFSSKVDNNPNYQFSHIAQFLYQLTLLNPNQEDFYNQVGDLKQQYQINLIFDHHTWSYQVEYQEFQFIFGLFASYFHDDKERDLLFQKKDVENVMKKQLLIFTHKID